MIRLLRNALKFCLATLVLTGLVYPFVVTVAARWVFPFQASGSLLVDRDRRVLGSVLLGQPVSRPDYFQPRPSVSDGRTSGGTNWGPTNARRAAVEREREANWRKENPEAIGHVPQELLTASASGFDPHLSPAAAIWQGPRVARARGVSLERVLALIQETTEGRTLGFLGEPRVNVMMLNRRLDEYFGPPGPAKKGTS